MSKKILEKYINNCKTKWYEDLGDLYYSTNITEDEFSEYANQKIDLFIKHLYESMKIDFKDYSDDKQMKLLCYSLRSILRKNLYCNKNIVFDLYDCIFQIPTVLDDHGLLPMFSYNFDMGLNVHGKDLIINVLFDDFQSCEYIVFQIRFHYLQCEGQYFDNFDEYLQTTKNFFTNKDEIEFYGLDLNAGDEGEDAVSVTIVKLTDNAHSFSFKLYDEAEADSIIENIENILNDTELLYYSVKN